jgi:hypothetical protein
MDCTLHTILHNEHKYTITHCIYIITNIHVITAKGLSIAQVILNRDKTVLSYTQNNSSIEISLIQEYLMNRIHPAIPTKYTLNQIHFRTAKHTFVANITEERMHYSVKTGGKGFVGCVEIMIDKLSNSMQLPTLSQIYSEPECWYKSFGTHNDIIDLIKGSLQLCQMLFGASKFTLSDNSAIECGGEKNISEKPPRKLKRSLSLAPLYVIKYGKTWYQYQFNAYMDTSNQQLVHAYNKGLSKLKLVIDLPFTNFIKRNRLTNQQIELIEPIYEKCIGKKSWFAFFNAIPDKKHCDVFFNWLPTFIDDYIMNKEFYMNQVKWIIDLGEEGHLVKETEPQKRQKVTNVPNNIPELTIDCEYTHEPITMVRTDLYILTDPEEVEPWKGGSVHGKLRNITRHRNRVLNEWKILSFSNDILPTRR